MRSPYDFDLLLPGDWWRLDLTSEEEIRGSLRRMLLVTGGHNDAQAVTRAELRYRMTNAALTAKSAGARHQFLALQISPGVPFPAVLTVYWPPLDVAERAPSSGEDAARALAALLENRPDPQGDRQSEFFVGESAVLRRSRLLSGPMLGVDGAPETEAVEASFWVTVPKTTRVGLFTFSCSLVSTEETLLDFFTVIMTTLAWPGLAPRKDTS